MRFEIQSSFKKLRKKTKLKIMGRSFSNKFHGELKFVFKTIIVSLSLRLISIFERKSPKPSYKL